MVMQTETLDARVRILGDLVRDILKTHVVHDPRMPFGPPRITGLNEYELARALLETGRVTTTEGASKDVGGDDLQPSPHELLRRVFDADEDKRVTWATAVLAQSGIAFLCWERDHEGTIHSLQSGVTALEAQVRQYERKVFE